MKKDHKDRNDHKKVTITTGPVYVPPINIIVPNDKLIVTLKNPTHKKLEAQVTLGICLSPNSYPSVQAPGVINGNSVQKFEVMESEINLGWFKVDPMSCLRVEKTFDNYQLFDSVIRLTATGDFKICEDSCEPICGLLEISSVVGFSGNWSAQFVTAIPTEITSLYQAYYGYSGVLGTDPQASVLYADWVFCEDHCPCESHSDSSSSCSDDH